jgi:hypothetical protein
VQTLTPADKVKRRAFCGEMQLRMEEDGSVERLISDEATFHIRDEVIRHNVRIWGTEQPLAQTEHQRDCPVVNIFCALSPFLFTETTMTGDTPMNSSPHSPNRQSKGA